MLRLFFIGCVMGVADLIPGISGGTIAFLSGIYEQLLTEIKALNFKTFSYKFFIPLGSGMILTLFSFAHLFNWLMVVAKPFVYAFFLGVVLTSLIYSFYKEKIKSVGPLLCLGLGWLCCYKLSGHINSAVSLNHMPGLLLAGYCAAVAMLLPGISGCYVLHILGVYPLVIGGLTRPLTIEGLKVLAPLAIGITIGMLSSARAILYAIQKYRQYTVAFFLGCMGGGLHCLYLLPPTHLSLWIALLLLGSITLIISLRAIKKVLV